jgi:hypothetical protein
MYNVRRKVIDTPYHEKKRGYENGKKGFEFTIGSRCRGTAKHGGTTK